MSEKAADLDLPMRRGRPKYLAEAGVWSYGTMGE
jgi:hypothetical protein